MPNSNETLKHIRTLEGTYNPMYLKLLKQLSVIALVFFIGVILMELSPYVPKFVGTDKTVECTVQSVEKPKLLSTGGYVSVFTDGKGSEYRVRSGIFDKPGRTVKLCISYSGKASRRHYELSRPGLLGSVAYLLPVILGGVCIYMWLDYRKYTKLIAKGKVIAAQQRRAEKENNISELP